MIEEIKAIEVEAIMPYGISYYETTVDLCGKDVPVTVGYTFHKGYPETREEPGERDHVELTSVMLDVQGDLVEIETSEEWDEEIMEEIMESL